MAPGFVKLCNVDVCGSNCKYLNLSIKIVTASVLLRITQYGPIEI